MGRVPGDLGSLILLELSFDPSAGLSNKDDSDESEEDEANDTEELEVRLSGNIVLELDVTSCF